MSLVKSQDTSHHNQYQLDFYILALSNRKLTLNGTIQYLHKTKYTGINLTKYVKNWYTENYKILKNLKKKKRKETVVMGW